MIQANPGFENFWPAAARTRYFIPLLFPRGILFTLLVLAHGFRRLLPPY